MKTRYLVIALLPVTALLIFFSCVSRYKVEMFMKADGEEKKVKVEVTEYIREAGIRGPYEQEKLEPRDASTVILRIGTRGQRTETDMTQTLFLGYDEYFRCLVYIEMPPTPQIGTTELGDNSFVQVLGRYDQSPEEKIFLTHGGYLTIDSVVNKRMFGSLDGDYRNENNISIKFRGQFKVKIED